MKKILLINPFGVGDVLFTFPLIRAIKSQRPQTEIHFIANRRTVELIRMNPDISRVMVYERDEHVARRRDAFGAYVQELLGQLRELRAQHYDAVIDLSLNPSIGMFTALAGIPRRVGFNYRNRGRFLTDKIPFKGYEDRHVAQYYLSLLPGLGLALAEAPMELIPDEESRAWAAETFLAAGIKAGRIPVAVVPGGGASWGKEASAKRWPAGNFAQTAQVLVENHNAVVILMGTPSESDLCRQVEEAVSPSVLNLCGKTTLPRAAAVLERCALAVVNDGGPLHLAVAVKTPTVSVFGPVDERVYGPFPAGGHRTVTADIPCRPCYRRFRRAQCSHISCLRDVVVEDVKKAVEELLNTQT